LEDKIGLTIEQKISFLSNIEDEMFLINEILLPMFNNMGKFKVIKTHGPNEKGKDIVLINEDEFAQKIYTGIIVKNESITNAANAKKNQEIVASVSNQIVMCINSGYDSIEENKNTFFSNLIVLTPKNISNSAREELVKISGNYKFTKLIFWESKELIEKIDKYLPDIYWTSSGALSRYFHILKEKCENLNELKKIAVYKGEAKKLSDIYIEPQLYKKKESIKNGRTMTVYANSTLSELLHESGRFMISGSAGAGKSTLLRSEIYKMIINYEIKKSDKIPVFIRIKDVIKCNGDNYESYITEYLSREFDLAAEEINLILKIQEKLVFFMDGFDELSTEDENRKFFAVLKVIENFQNNAIIITSRKIKLIDKQLIPYSKWEVSDFTIKQIANFFQKWFKDKNEQLVSDLKDHDLLDKLPNTPLVMTLIAVLFEMDENVEIPANLSELYKMFTELLIGRWNLDRRIDTFYKANDKETFLTDLAVFLHSNNNVSCTESELFHVFDMTAKKLGRKFDYSVLLDEIIKDTNLLIQNEKNEYEFRHLSFQEYFVGVHLTIKNDIDDIIKVFPHPWWDQVLYFYCGTRKVNDDVLPKIYEKVLTCPDREKILGIFEIGYLIQSSYKTDAKVRSELLQRSLIDYSLVIPKYIKKMLDERKNIPKIIFYLSFIEMFKSHFNSKYLQEIYISIYEYKKNSTFDTFEKAMSLFLLTAIIAANGNVDILADCDIIFKEFPLIQLMEDFLIRCELLEEIEDKKQKELAKEQSRKIIKRIKSNKNLFKKLLK
jgi:hypothetical protein